jgi:hypothetical protein
MGALRAGSRTMVPFRVSQNPQGARNGGGGCETKSNNKNSVKCVFDIKLAFKLCKLIVCVSV